MNIMTLFRNVFFTLILLFGAHELAADFVSIASFPGTNPKVLFYNANAARDECALPFCKLRESLEADRHLVKFVAPQENVDRRSHLISFNNISKRILSSLSKVSPTRKKLLFVFEPPVVMPEIYDPSLSKHFDKIFVMLDDYVDNVKYFKFNFPQPRLHPIEEEVPFEEKKFCALIAGNKKSKHPSELYSERVKTIKFFQGLKTSQLDLYGPGWSGYSSWKGMVESKWETLAKYKFCICYENMQNQNGYITEKIFDCLIAKCVPIYWGASNIDAYIPKDCFIDRRQFSSNKEMYDYLVSIDEETYLKFQISAQKYLDSPESKQFSVDHFVKLVMEELKQKSTQKKLLY